ncbi:MAG TPA: bacillithiol biosynthesis cysteine-adding enzyme BshC [Vicinamibacteria bacterium]|nr:bacillithiol biosynthesis cysteine-adding enzyme BshC [Vicinamibacteria bacterium]
MNYNGRSMASRAPVVLDYGAFQQPPSPLFRDYLTGAPGVRPFYAFPRWDLEGVVDAADRATRAPRPREGVADALVRQQEGRRAPRAAARAALLRDPRATAVVTGQQAVLFGGPLFVLYTAVAAVAIARALEERRGAPVVPVFWVASDDHDFAEIRSTTVLDQDGQLHDVRYAPRHEPVGLPASRIVLDETVGEIVEELRRRVPASLYRDEAVDLVAGCYRPGVGMADAFACLLSALFPDLVVLDPADPALKALSLPVFSRELVELSPTSRLAAEAGQALLAAGYHQQVPVRPGFLNLFAMVGGERRALGWDGATIEVRGTGRRMPVAEARALLESDPAAFSAGVLLRPLAQDLLLPTAAYVGGPAEIAYHAQIGPSYAHFGIPRPVLVPRPSLTLVEPAQARALEAEELSLPDLQRDPQGVLSRWARQAYPEVEEGFERARQAVEKEMTAVEETLAALDPTLRAAADAARGRALHQVDGLEEKAMRALKKRDQSRADRLRRTRDALMPGGSFQERGMGLVNLLARQGRAAIDDVQQRMDPFARGHQVVFL